MIKLKRKITIFATLLVFGSLISPVYAGSCYQDEHDMYEKIKTDPLHSLTTIDGRSVNVFYNIQPVGKNCEARAYLQRASGPYYYVCAVQWTKENWRTTLSCVK